MFTSFTLNFLMYLKNLQHSIMIVVEQNLSRFLVFHDLCPIWPSQLKSKIFENKNVSKEISVQGKWYIGEEQKLKK